MSSNSTAPANPEAGDPHDRAQRLQIVEAVRHHLHERPRNVLAVEADAAEERPALRVDEAVVEVGQRGALDAHALEQRREGRVLDAR